MTYRLISWAFYMTLSSRFFVRSSDMALFVLWTNTSPWILWVWLAPYWFLSLAALRMVWFALNYDAEWAFSSCTLFLAYSIFFMASLSLVVMPWVFWGPVHPPMELMVFQVSSCSDSILDASVDFDGARSIGMASYLILPWSCRKFCATFLK